MKNSPSLFRVKAEIPEHQEEMPVYQSASTKTHSRRDERSWRLHQRRVKRYTRYFEMDAEPDDQGDMIVIRDEEESLEIYLTSDSVWWTNRRLAYNEDIDLARNLPSPQSARAAADRVLKEMDVDMELLRFRSTDYTQVSIAKTRKGRPRSYRTSICTTYGFELDSLPVFGAGAKAQVSMVEKGVLSEVLVFWRGTRRSGKCRAIHPYQALERFFQDDSFVDLKPGEATVVIDRMRLGYFAMNPTAVQRYLIPVYEVSGSVSTEHLEKEPFTLHVTATDMAEERMKVSAVRARPGYHAVFSSD